MLAYPMDGQVCNVVPSTPVCCSSSDGRVKVGSERVFQKMKRVGELACQVNSYLRKISATVVSCEPSAEKAGLHETILSDSVLFPEGGGQPCDRGTLNGYQVLDVQRRGDSCVVFTKEPLENGAVVDAEVDWERREDHMQHHTAQHVVTAVLERLLGHPTMSWSLTSPTCFVQLPVARVDEQGLMAVERACNALISLRTPVQCLLFASKNELPPSRSRGIPDDVNGPIRIIDIEGCDACTCCGTHVGNLAELQVIKLLHQEPKGNTCRLHFIAGQRAIAQLGALHELTRALTKELGTNKENFLAVIARRAEELTAANKRAKRLDAQLLPFLSAQIVSDVAARAADRADPYFFHHDDLEIDALSAIASDITKTLAATERRAPAVVLGCGAGDDLQFVVSGDDAAVMGPQVAALLDGKGGLSKTVFRGKGSGKKWKAMVKQLTKK